MEAKYLHLTPGSELPSVPIKTPFAAVVIIEADITSVWRDAVSRWLVGNGCLFMMAWGKECSLWDDSVDYANLEEFDFAKIPDDRYVLTTWHDDETLEEVLWFAQCAAHHDAMKRMRLLLLDISAISRQTSVMEQLARSADLHLRNPE